MSRGMRDCATALITLFEAENCKNSSAQGWLNEG